MNQINVLKLYRQQQTIAKCQAQDQRNRVKTRGEEEEDSTLECSDNNLISEVA